MLEFPRIARAVIEWYYREQVVVDIAFTMSHASPKRKRGKMCSPSCDVLTAVENGGAGTVSRGLVSADRIPWGMTLSPDGRFLAVTGYEVGSLVLYAIAADGSIHRAATLACDKHITDIIAR
jgi:hypothetical protein